MKTVLAFDFGASSGRAIKATFDGNKISYNEIHRFDNIPIMVDSHVCHNVPMIMTEIHKSIEKAGNIDSLAFDTWGVDYGLLDSNGQLLHMPYHYRDERTKDAIEKAQSTMSLSQLYAKTGNQIMRINTLFQIICDNNINNATKLLFMPDLFAYLLCKNITCEKTIASTSQMLNLNECKFDNDVLSAFNIDKSIFPAVCNCATVNGYYNNIKVISVAGHDTQCAIAAMPTKDSDNIAFLSCGTWSLIGCELDKPILTEKSNKLELSNELGANGKINFLKNISGLWLIQETKKALNEFGNIYSYNDLEMLARESEPFKFFIDPDDDILSRHGNIVEKIKEYCKSTKQNSPNTIGEIVRCIYESLALKYRFALEQISECTNKKFRALHLLGGGTKDAFLCEMTANSINLPVIAGPIEATALGNIMLQLIALGEINDIDGGRKLIKKSEKLTTYNPNHTDEWEKAYQKYVKTIIEKI